MNLTIDDISIGDHYKLSGGQTLNTFDNGQLIYRFNAEETLINSCDGHVINISENCRLGRFLKQLAEKFLCESIVHEGRISIQTARYMFNTDWVLCKELTLFLRGVLNINNHSYLSIKLIEYK